MSPRPTREGSRREELQWRSQWGGTVEYEIPKGSTLLRQGDAVAGVFLLRAGCVKLFSVDGAGRETLVGLRRPGWLVGAAAAVLALPHAVSAQSLGPCRVAAIDIDHFRHVYASDIALAHAVGRMQALEIYEQVAQLDRRAGAVLERLERLLLELSEGGVEQRRDGSLRLITQLTHEEMAQAISVRRETVSRLLSSLSRRGELVSNRGWLELPATSQLVVRLKAVQRSPTDAQSQSAGLAGIDVPGTRSMGTRSRGRTSRV